MEINCKFFTEENHYICGVRLCSITKRNMKVTFVGEHEEGKTDLDVTALIFMSPVRLGNIAYLERWIVNVMNTYRSPPEPNVVEYIPKDLHIIFPRLKLLEVHNCGLKSITRKDLMGFKYLEELRLNRNDLTSIPNNLLINMHHLKIIGFATNKIDTVSSKLLRPILGNDLRFVGFSGNSSIDTLYSDAEHFGPNIWSVPLPVLLDMLDQCKEPEKDYATSDEFKELWKDETKSDFIINVELEKFHVHKHVLAKRSTVFEAMFTHCMREHHEGIMKIEGFSSESVKEFLCHIYTGEHPDETNALELFELARKYRIADFERSYEELIIQNIDFTNAVDIYKFGQLHSSDDIKGAAFSEMRCMFPEKNLSLDLIDSPKLLSLISKWTDEQNFSKTNVIKDLSAYNNCPSLTIESSSPHDLIESV